MVAGSSDFTPRSCFDFVKSVCFGGSACNDSSPGQSVRLVVECQNFRLDIVIYDVGNIKFSNIRLNQSPGREAVGSLACQRAADAARLHAARVALDHPAVGRLAVLSNLDAEQPLAVLVEEVTGLPPPLGGEFRLVAREDVPMIRLSAQRPSVEVLGDELTLPVPRAERHHQPVDRPLVQPEQELIDQLQVLGRLPLPIARHHRIMRRALVRRRPLQS